MLVIALAVLMCTAALFGVSIGFKDKTTNTRIGPQSAEIGDMAFYENSLLIGTTSTTSANRVYSVDAATGNEQWSTDTQSYVRKIKVFDSFVAVALENNTILILNANGEILAENLYLYPVIDFDYDEQTGFFAVAGSVSQSTNAVFVTENFQKDRSYGENDFSYYVPSNVYPIGIAIADGAVCFAGSNSKVYRCAQTGRATEIFNSRYTQNSFLASNGYYVLGYVNGQIDIYRQNKETSAYEVVQNFALGQKEVLLSKSEADAWFCAAEKGGNLAFYSLEDFACLAKGKGTTLVTRLAVSRDGTAVLLKNNSLFFADQSLLVSSKVFSIIFILAVVLFAVSLLWAAFAAIRLIPKHGKVVENYVVTLGKDLYKDKKCYLLLLPAFAFLAVFVFWPILQGFIIAFQDYVPGVRAEWVGFENFAEVFQNTYFWGSMKNMVILLITDLLKALIPPLIIAECIIALTSWRSQYAARVLMYIPGILPGLAGTLIWTSGILGSEGILSQVLGGLGFEQFANFNWLGHSSTALGSLILIGFPWVGSYIILYGALMSVPGEYYDAAKLDGFNWIKRIAFIDLPMIRPQLKYIFVLSFIGSIQDFQRVYMTTGGSYGTNIPSLEIYYNINTFNNYGAAAAMGVLLFIIIFIATLFNMRVKTED